MTKHSGSDCSVQSNESSDNPTLPVDLTELKLLPTQKGVLEKIWVQ